MQRYVTERLMTVDEAQRLSDPTYGQNTRDERSGRTQRQSIWAWQTVEGVMAQTITEEQVADMHQLLKSLD